MRTGDAIVNEIRTPGTGPSPRESQRKPKRQDNGTDRIVLRRERGSLYVRDSNAVGATVLTLLGAAFTVVGLVDLGLLWNPPNFGNSSWEFATLSQTFDNLPMTGLGLGLLAFGFLFHPRSRPLQVRVIGAVFGLVTLGLLVMGVLYFTVAPEVMRQAPPEAVNALNRAVTKNVAEIIMYPVVFGVLAILLWRSVRRVG